MEIKELKQHVMTTFTELTQVRPTDNGSVILRLPFFDNDGDPIELFVHTNENSAVINDGGAVAGLLFSLGQHHDDSPAFALLKDIAGAHRLAIDFDEGLISLTVDQKDLYQAITEMAKAVITIQTTAPFLRNTQDNNIKQHRSIRTHRGRQPSHPKPGPMI